MDIETLCQSEFEHIAVLRDPRIGLLAFVVIHDGRRGPAFGGIRRWGYARADEALADALRLAAAMTLKCAVSDVPGGGGKTVLVQSDRLDRAAAYRAIGRAVEELGGRYYTGPDVGTTADDLECVAEHTEYVALPSAACGDLSVPTALGVFAGIEAVGRRLGFDGIRGAHVVVQGLGEVGVRVARHLAEAGARLTIADVRADVVDSMCAELEAARVDPAEVLDVACDVFAPCALGGVIHAGSVDRLRARAIAGSANNVLADPELGRELARREVLYAPDFVINSGALIHGALFHLDGEPPPEERVLSIGECVGEILDRARADHASTDDVARALARERTET